MQITIIVIVVIALWLPAFIDPVPMWEEYNAAPFYNLLLKWLSGTPRLASGLALVLVVMEGFMLNQTLYHKKLIQHSTLLPSFVYIVMMSLGHDSLTLTPIVFTNLCLIFMIRHVVARPNLTMELTDMFSAAMFTCIAALFFTPMVWMVLGLLFLIPVYKLYTWRQWMMMLLGFTAPLYPLATYWLWKDQLLVKWQRICDSLMAIGLDYSGGIALQIMSMMVLLVVVYAIANGLSLASGQTLMVQKSASAIGSWIVPSLLVMFYMPLFPVKASLVAIAAAHLCTFYLLTLKKKTWIVDIVTLVILTIALISNL